jgi:putative oxidoreductase
MKIVDLLVRTDQSGSTLLLRFLLGLIFFPHGAQKVLGWFGGYGFTASMGFFTETMHIAAPLAFLAIAAEFAGAIALILGLFTRMAAFGIIVNMAVAILMVHGQNGFFMNWSGSQKGEGFEYHLLTIGVGLVLLVRGGGKWAIDTLITDKIAESNSVHPRVLARA